MPPPVVATADGRPRTACGRWRDGCLPAGAPVPPSPRTVAGPPRRRSCSATSARWTGGPTTRCTASASERPRADFRGIQERSTGRSEAVLSSLRTAGGIWGVGLGVPNVSARAIPAIQQRVLSLILLQGAPGGATFCDARVGRWGWRSRTAVPSDPAGILKAVGFLAAQATNLVVGLISGFVSGLLVAWILGRREQRCQVRKVTADITLDGEPVPGQAGGYVLRRGCLTVANRSDWPVRDVIVTAPPPIAMLTPPYLGPGSERSRVIPAESLHAAEVDDMPITVQLEDVRGKTWRWVPRTGELSPIPEPIPWYSHIVQGLDKRSPRFHRLLWKLPPRLRSSLWGYDPVG